MGETGNPDGYANCHILSITITSEVDTLSRSLSF